MSAIITKRRLPPKQNRPAAPKSVALNTAETEVLGVTIPYNGNSDSGDAVGAIRLAYGMSVWVIDVEGKGSPAASFANALHGVAHEHALRGTTNPVAILDALHQACLFYETRAAATVMSISAKNTVRIGVAGVQSPFIVDYETGMTSIVEASGMTLGFPFLRDYTVSEINLSPGCLLVTGSDGLYEAEDGHGEFMSIETLGRTLQGHSGLSMASNLIRVLDAVHEHSPEPRDDLSVIMLRCGDSTSSFAATIPQVRPLISGRNYADSPVFYEEESHERGILGSPAQLRDLAYAS